MPSSPTVPGRLNGRIALITAAGAGMGRAVACRLASEGAHVIATSATAANAEATALMIKEAGGSAESYALDVCDIDQIQQVLERVRRSHGTLHVLHNHAGIPGPGGLEVSKQTWDHVVAVNLGGAFFVTAAALPLLRQAGGSASIVITSSAAGLVGSPLSPIYSMTKGGVILLMRSLALQLAPEGIRVNAVCPGPTASAMLPEFFGRERGASVADVEFASMVPLGRPGTPSEIAAAVAFLASDDSSFVTGVALPVDGGYLAR